MKKYVSLILALMLVFSLAACSSNDAGSELKEAVGVTIPAFSLNVNGTVITDAELADCPVYEVSATSTNNSGTESTCVFVGFSLKDVLDVAGVSDFENLTAIASDGYEVEVDAAMALEPSTLIAISKDGEQMKDGPWFAPCTSATTGDYNKGVVAISLDGAEVDINAAQSEGGEAGGLPEIADKTDKVQFGDFSFKVNGTEVTNASLDGLHIYKIEVTTVNSKGSESTATYTGYKLADVLAACGVNAAAKVTVTANDGYEAELNPDYIGSDYTLVAIEKDKEVGEDGTIWVAPCESGSSGDYCKLAVEIIAE